MEPPTGTKLKIVDAAIELFSEKGFHETSVRDIARQTGIRVSSLYSHFPGKDAILDAILQWYEAQVDQIRIPPEKLESVVDSVPPKKLLLTGFQRVKAVTGSPRMGQVIRILVMEMYRNPRVREFYLKWYFEENQRSIQQVFKQMRRKGLIRKGSPEALARMYNALVNHCYLEYFLCKAGGGETSSLEKHLERFLSEIFDLFIEY